MQVLTKPDTASGIPVYLQLVEQVKHAVATGALEPGDQLPGVRKVAEQLVINPNTVVKAWRELEHEGFIEVHHGAGAFISHSAPGLRRTALIADAQQVVQGIVRELRDRGLTDAEIRRLIEREVTRVPHAERVPFE